MNTTKPPKQRMPQWSLEQGPEAPKAERLPKWRLEVPNEHLSTSLHSCVFSHTEGLNEVPKEHLSMVAAFCLLKQGSQVRC